jgi:hypothetical protein
VQQLVYTMQWKGQAIPQSETVFHVKEKIASTSITTVLNQGGITGGFDPAAVAEGEFETTVELQSNGTFLEHGTIRLTNGHGLHFRTKVPGWMDTSPDQRYRQGTVTFEVTGGEGQLAKAQGIITSNFFISQEGEVTEHHIGILYIP